MTLSQNRPGGQGGLEGSPRRGGAFWQKQSTHSVDHGQDREARDIRNQDHRVTMSTPQSRFISLGQTLVIRLRCPMLHGHSQKWTRPGPARSGRGRPAATPACWPPAGPPAACAGRRNGWRAGSPRRGITQSTLGTNWSVISPTPKPPLIVIVERVLLW